MGVGGVHKGAHTLTLSWFADTLAHSFIDYHVHLTRLRGREGVLLCETPHCIGTMTGVSSGEQ